MIESYLLNHPWLPASLWAVLYTSDYQLTLWGARLHGKQDVYRYEGSYELTPDYQEDVDKQKPVSFTFILWLVAGAIILLATGYIPGSKAVYGAIVGYFLTLEVAVHLRHIDNISLYRSQVGPNPSASGSIVFTRTGLYRRSAVQLAGFASATLIAYAITGSPILLGGAVSVSGIALRHLRLARRRAKPGDGHQQPAPEKPEEDEITSDKGAGSNV